MLTVINELAHTTNLGQSLFVQSLKSHLTLVLVLLSQTLRLHIDTRLKRALLDLLILQLDLLRPKNLHLLLSILNKSFN
jgi:hypothetical protein